MNNSSWVPPQQQNQLNLEQEYVYDSSTEYNQEMGYQANWRGGCGPQHFPASFHPNQTQSSHTAYLSPGDASSQQINDEGRQFQQLQPRFSMSSQNAVDGGIRTSSNEGYGPSSLNRIQVDYGLRYASPHSSSPSGPASAYPNSPTSQLGQYPGRGVVGGVRAPNPYPRDTPTSLQNQSTNDNNVSPPRFVQTEQPHRFPQQQPQAYQQSPTRPQSLQSQRIFSDQAADIPSGLDQGAVGAKRQRTFDDSFSSYHDSAGDLDLGVPREDAHRIKLGACARCKNLKVKCEFRLDSDTCKRCLNGGHECVIPGRKKRRVPPKREHLLNQIRDQATEIQRLMKQLEFANQRISSAASPPSENASVSEIGSTVLESNEGNPFKNQADVQDWVAKARESIEAFGGFIGIGTGSGARKLIEDSDSSESDWDDVVELESDYEEGSTMGGEYQDNRWEEAPSAPVYSRPSPDDAGKKKEAAGDKLATIPSQAAPFGLMANLSLRRTRMIRGASAEAEDRDEVGVVRDDYFRASTPDPAQRVLDPGHHEHPHILTRGIVTPEQVETLFRIYFDYMNLSLSLLDPVLYTAHSTYYRSPFLFTVICAIASRHYAPKPNLYAEAMRHAKLAAGTALISGQKTIETVQAYILLALNPTPVKKWDEDRSWLYLGLAIRVAVDLNLHIRSTAKPQNEIHARELLNRTRVWLNCFNLDRSTGSVYGKGPMLPNSDYVANHSGDWWKSSEYNIQGFDIHLCAYNAELRLIGNFRAKIYTDPEHPTGLNKEINFEQLASETDDQLVVLRDYWLPILAQNTDPNDRQAQFRNGLSKLAYSYARLVALSFGFQRTGGKNDLEDNPFITRCWRAAKDVCLVLLDDLNIPEQRIFLRHGPEAQSVFVTFAAAFLVKLLHLKFITCFNLEQRQGMHEMVQRVIDALGSPEFAIDDHHGPKLYSRFLRGLLDTAKFDPGSSRRRPKTKSQSPRPYRDQLTPPVLSVEPSPALTSSQSLASSARSSAIIEPYEYAPQAEQMYTSGSLLASDEHNQSVFAMNVPEFFVAPLPFDKEMLQSMHTLTNSTDWNGVALPGWNWMGQLQGNDTDMKDSIPNPRMYYANEQLMQ